MQFQLEIPTTQKVDHLIVISPPDEIMSLAWEIKREVEKIIGVYKSRTSTPHITICKSVLTTGNEGRITEQWQSLFIAIPAFRMRVKGLKVFETSGTLYLETDYPEELKEIRKELYIKNKELRISKQFYSLISTPHITIGRGLSKESLNKLEDYISKRVCDKEFYVKDLLGLRADSADVKYQKRYRFKLKE